MGPEIGDEMDDQKPTPAEVAKHATEEAKLERTALIGIFGEESAPQALIRQRSGQILKVATGDKVGNQEVAAIGEDHLVLKRGGNTKVLRLPQG